MSNIFWKVLRQRLYLLRDGSEPGTVCHAPYYLAPYGVPQRMLLQTPEIRVARKPYKP